MCTPGCWRELRYHGDWMLRPIASNEVAPLVRLLVAVSARLNAALGLTGVPSGQQEEPPETVTQVCVARAFAFISGGAGDGHAST